MMARAGWFGDRSIGHAIAIVPTGEPTAATLNLHRGRYSPHRTETGRSPADTLHNGLVGHAGANVR
jgi:hypothetical protein